MKLRDPLHRRPLMLVLAFAATVAMVAISETAYLNISAALAALGAIDEASRNDLHQALMISRIGVTVLAVIGLVALALLMRQAREQRALQALVQAAHDRLEIDVAQRTAQLTELTHHLQTAREDERQRLARDLHDELGALLTSATLDAARIRSRLGEAAPEARERLTHLVQTLDQVIELKRSITEELRPSALGHLGLPETLQILAREFTERSGLPVHCTLATVPLSPAAELVVYRLVQEAINNISKYARASAVWLSLHEQRGLALVSVRDDGVGFDLSGGSLGGHGLMGMRFRAEAERGTLLVVSSPGQGTRIELSLPAAA